MIRPLEARERERLRQFLDGFRPGLLEAWEREGEAEFQGQDAGKKVRLFLVGRALAQSFAEARDGPEPQSAGLLVGHLDGDRVVLSLEGAFEVGRRSESGKVWVNQAATQAFLYGRGILGESVLRADPGLTPGRVALVANERGEVLGLATVKRKLPGRGEVLRSVVDRGWYLRGGG